MRANGHPCAVLVVEDDWLVRHSIVGLFQSEGWLVMETASGEEALLLASHNDVDAVFTDIQLSGRVDGWGVAEALRLSRPGLAVVYASGDANDRSRQVPKSRFFHKPYMAEEVISTCGDLINGRRDIACGHAAPAPSTSSALRS
jgi:CheY-like chemotaxis protein